MLVVDKDGTVISPIGRSLLPTSPSDQMVMPGVQEKLDKALEQGHTIFIASNQGGVKEVTVEAKDFPAGALIKEVSGRYIRVTRVENAKSYTFLHGESDDVFTIEPNLRVTYRWKTLDQAAEEMQFALKLLPQVTLAYFCPDDGETCYKVSRYGFSQARTNGIKNFRKPGPGMLQLIAADYPAQADKKVFVGDMETDQQAAESAEFEFIWEKDWR